MKLLKIIYIKRLTDALIKFVDKDFKSNLNESETWLYRMLYDTTDDSDFNFYEQAKACFTDTDSSSMKIQTSLGWGKNINGSPYVFIREMSKNKGIYNGIGGIDSFEYLNDDKNYGIPIYRDTRKSEYELMVVTNNSLLTTLIAEVIYALYIGAWESVSEEFDLFDINIRDMAVNQDINTPLFFKSVTVSCQHENIIPSIILDETVNANTINFTINKLNDQSLDYGD